jgi:hypothetical protein
LGWSEKEFWEATPRKLWACFYNFAICKGYIKTKKQVEDEETQKKIDSINLLKSMKGKM